MASNAINPPLRLFYKLLSLWLRTVIFTVVSLMVSSPALPAADIDFVSGHTPLLKRLLPLQSFANTWFKVPLWHCDEFHRLLALMVPKNQHGKCELWQYQGIMMPGSLISKNDKLVGRKRHRAKRGLQTLEDRANGWQEEAGNKNVTQVMISKAP